MKVIPAIDIRRGKVVRLEQGEFDKEKVYSVSPLEAAKNLMVPGVDTIHIIDLDGALTGQPKNLDAVKEIIKVLKIKVELGGGIRDEAVIKNILDAGIDKVIIGTKALDTNFLKSVAKKFGDKIIVGIDAKQGLVRTAGWTNKTSKKAIDLAKEAAACGIKTINYTDISRDGMLEGPNIASLKEILAAARLDVIASGGISSMEDLKKLKALEKDGLKGVIIGKAIYENRLDLAEAVKLCSQKE